MNKQQLDQNAIAINTGVELFRDETILVDLTRIDGLFLLKQMLLGLSNGTLIVIEKPTTKPLKET